MYPVQLQHCGGKDIEDNLRIGGIKQITICLHLQPIKVRFRTPINGHTVSLIPTIPRANDMFLVS